MAPELAVTPPPLRDWTPPPAPPEPEEDDGDDEPYHDPGRRPPQRYYVRNSATGLPSARTVGTLTLIVLGLAGVGSLLAAGLAMVAVINADDKSRGLAVAVSTPMVVTTFLAFLVTVFWAGLIGTLLRIEDRLTEIASSR